jgi:hypothetical protein
MTTSRFLFLLGCLALVHCGERPLPELSTPERLSVPAAPGSVGARLTSGNGQVLLSWMERNSEGATLRVAELTDAGWGPAIDVVDDPKMLVNWADLPSVLSIVKGAKKNSQWAAHWLSYSDTGPHAYDVRVARSMDGGATWSEAVTPHADGTPTEHGFVSKFRSPQGIGLIWLDGRNTINEADGNLATTGTSLRSAVLAADGSLRDQNLVDDLVCDCCATSVVVSSSGPLAAYRDRSSEEVRDIAVSRFRNGQWTAGRIVADDGWVIEGCPVNGPVIAASGELVGVAWFTAAGDRPRIRVSISRDGGNSFPEPVELAAGTVAGYVDIAFMASSAFAVSWVEHAAEGQLVRVSSLTADGERGDALTVAHTAALSVPQLEYRQGELIIAWTDAADEEPRIATASLEVRFAP